MFLDFSECIWLLINFWNKLNSAKHVMQHYLPKINFYFCCSPEDMYQNKSIHTSLPKVIKTMHLDVGGRYIQYITFTSETSGNGDIPWSRFKSNCQHAFITPSICKLVLQKWDLQGCIQCGYFRSHSFFRKLIFVVLSKFKWIIYSH